MQRWLIICSVLFSALLAASLCRDASAQTTSDAEYNAGISAAARGEHGAAVQHYSRAIDIELKERQPNQSAVASILLPRALSLIILRDFARALDDINQTLKFITEAADSDASLRLMALKYRAHCYFNLKRFDEALADTNEVIEAYPKDREMLVQRGQIHLGADRYNLALEDFAHAVEVAPNDLVARLYIGATYEKIGNLEKARDTYREIYNTDQQGREFLERHGKAEYVK